MSLIRLTPERKRGHRLNLGPTNRSSVPTDTVRGSLSGPLGYGLRIEHPETKAKVRELARRSPARMVVQALFYWMQIILSVVLAGTAFASGYVTIAAMAYLLAALWIGRTMRAFECLIHEFAHGVWPKMPTLDDIVGNVMFAYPLALTIDGMRKSHNQPHHVDLGRIGVDPDLLRYNELDAHELDRSSFWGFFKNMLIRMPRYYRGWFRALGTKAATVVLAVLWHSLAIAIIALARGDVGLVLSGWIAFWLVPYLLVLPIIRFIGENGEHIYHDGNTVMSTTVSNIGPVHRLLIHPVGDGYHSLHHCFANVPGYNLHRLHEWMLSNEPDYRVQLRFRMKILENPRRL